MMRKKNIIWFTHTNINDTFLNRIEPNWDRQFFFLVLDNKMIKQLVSG